MAGRIPPAGHRLPTPVLDEFPSLTENIDISQPVKHPIQHHLPTTGRPCFGRPRKRAPQLSVKVNTELDKLLQQGIIEPSSLPWSSTLHVVHGKLSLCLHGGYRTLNLAIEKGIYGLSRLLEFQNRIHGATIFSTLELKSAYHQIAQHITKSRRSRNG